MANEITIVASVACNNSPFTLPTIGGSVRTDQTGIGGGAPGAVQIGASEEDIDFGDVTPGWVYVKNLDATYTFRFGPKSGASMVALADVAPEESAGPFFLSSGVTLRGLAVSLGTADPIWVQIVGLNQ